MMRVFSVSDLHTDYSENLKRVKNILSSWYQNDVLIVAGDVAETYSNFLVAMSELKKRFGVVFFVPGNHDLWCRREDGAFGNSATKKVNDEMIINMHEEAKRLWNPELAVLMKNTKQPFINIIYDSDPLQKLFHDNVVFLGDAAHPTTPHASRSTNMSILDAEVLGLCLRKRGLESTSKALEEFQNIRKPVVSEQVMYSRYMGRLKQSLLVDGNIIFEFQDIQHKSIPFYEHVPVSG